MAQHIIGGAESLIDPQFLVDHLEQPVIWDHNQRIHLLGQFLDRAFGRTAAVAAFKAEGPGDHTNRQCTLFAGNAGDDRGGAGTGAAAHAGGHKDHVSTFEHLGDLFAAFLGSALADFWVATGAKPFGQLIANAQAHRRAREHQRLRVGVDGDELDALDAFIDHTIDRILAAATDTDHLDRSEIVHELGVTFL